jgi:uncharacterized DUF497 family protein
VSIDRLSRGASPPALTGPTASAGDTVAWPEYRPDYGETRVRVIGDADGLLLHVVFTGRGNVRRIISARMANRKERTQWHGSR